MSDIREAREALVARILGGNGTTSLTQRSEAFNNAWRTKPTSTLIERVATHARKVSDEDITAAKESGLSEDQVFEIVVCAAVGQATRQYDAALAALREAESNEHAPKEPR